MSRSLLCCLLFGFAGLPCSSSAQDLSDFSTLTISAITDSTLNLRCPTEAGFLYKVQQSDSLLWTNPVDLSEFTLAAGPSFDLQVDLQNTVPYRFFRVVRRTDANKTPLVVFDTDMGPDIDDAVALALLHGYQDAGMIEIAAVSVCRDSTIAARYVDVVNTAMGRPDIPIGIYRSGTVSSIQANNNRFTVLAPNYPHDVHLSPIADGYTLARDVLANAGERPVLLIQTGFSGTFSALMDSGGDVHSPLSGRALAAAAEAKLFLAAGWFGASRTEFNIEHDLSSARNLFATWPGEMVVSDWPVGAGLIYPYDRGIRDAFAPSHPVRAGYEQRVLTWHRNIDPNPPREFYNMVSWDLNPIIHAIEPDGNYYGLSSRGTVILSAAGRSTFVEDPQGKHTILLLPEDRQRTIDRMVELIE